MLHLTRPASAHLSHLNPFAHARRIHATLTTNNTVQNDTLTRVLDIPLLCDEIASSLTPYTLALCTQVCRTWHKAFSPLLWANLSFVNQYTVSLFRNSPAIQLAILQQAHHIRSIHSVFCYTFESLPIQPHLFQNLTLLDSLVSELHNKGIVDHTNAVRLLEFVKVNSSLREVRLTVFPLANVSVSELLGSMLACHPGLVRASITCFTEAHLEGIRHVLRGAGMGRLESLRLTCRANNNNSSAFNSSANSTALSSATNIDLEQEVEPLLPEGHVARHFKELYVDAELEHMYHLTILPLLKHCPNLESLLVAGLDMTRSIKDLCEVVEGTTTRLRHLMLGYSKDGRLDDDDDEQYARLIESCQTDQLQSLVLQNGGSIGRQSIRALLAYSRQHRFTLQTLDLENCLGGGIGSKGLLQILTSCPNLTTFLAMAPLSGRTSTSSATASHSSNGSRNHADMRIDIRYLPTGMGNQPAWVCLRLQHLSIGFSGFMSLDNSSDSTTAVASPPPQVSARVYVDHIYAQLGLLTELRTLHLGGEIEFLSGTGIGPGTGAAGLGLNSAAWAFDLSLQSGLDRLKGLTRLRELDVQRIWHHRISARECAWMGQCWTNLRIFRGYGGPIVWQTVTSGGGGGGTGGSGGGGVKRPLYVGEMKKHCPKVDVWMGPQRVS
ncbi:hypothetical protein BGX33_008151 [Mortierella sp. NVP41]|nr:hypothetical protein BGX33_008151 [Mortierella sp. NVP41]